MENEKALTPQEFADPEDVMNMLKAQAEVFWEPGFSLIKVGRDTALFSSDTFGSGEEIIGIILAIEPTRSLWPFGSQVEETKLEEYFSGRPICSARHMDCLRGKGSLTKVLEDGAPKLVKDTVAPIINENFRCSAGKDDGCPYSAFGSDGDGMMCKENKRLLLYNPESRAFGVLVATATSLDATRKYFASLPDGFQSVLTRFTLEQKSKGKWKWCVLKPSVAGEATHELIAPLGRKVHFQGQYVMEAQAISAVFLRQDIDKEMDYPTDDDSVPFTDSTTPAEGDEF